MSASINVNGHNNATDNNARIYQQSSTVQSSAAIVNSGGKQIPAANIESNKNPDQVMNHVVESYNEHGKVRIKFVDSKNNVVYQFPTEMMAKVEDQMNKPGTSTDIKG